MPGIVFEMDFEILEPQEALVMKIVSPCTSIGLDMHVGDIIEFSKHISHELRTEELEELQK